MDIVITIGLDIAKNFFQVHGVGDEGQVVLGLYRELTWIKEIRLVFWSAVWPIV